MWGQTVFFPRGSVLVHAELEYSRCVMATYDALAAQHGVDAAYARSLSGRTVAPPMSPSASAMKGPQPWAGGAGRSPPTVLCSTWTLGAGGGGIGERCQLGVGSLGISIVYRSYGGSRGGGDGLEVNGLTGVREACGQGSKHCAGLSWLVLQTMIISAHVTLSIATLSIFH